jgi:carbon monoxide dehydrogenase subunit G
MRTIVGIGRSAGRVRYGGHWLTSSPRLTRRRAEEPRAVELTHQFTVPVPIADAWVAFNDLERIAPCFPGAALTSYDGENFEGLVKIKLGPISLQYNGTGRFIERDEGAHKAVIEAKGKDKRGNGTAAANITATLEAAGDAATTVIVATDLNITGKPAQFGRGVMQDVSDKLLGQFAGCLETKLGQPDTDLQAETYAAATDQSADAGDEAAARAKHRADSTAARLASADGSAEPMAAELDLGATVLPVLLKRYAPQVIGGLVVLWLLKKILGRS